MMKDSTLNPQFLQELMRLNPPSLRPNGDIFSGPVRLCFPNLFKPQAAKGPDSSSDEKYGADLLFPLGSDLKLFNEIWFREARKAHPNNWDPQTGNPIGLHAPFHDQAEKAYGAKPKAGYTPGAIHFTASSKFKPVVVDSSMNPIVDEAQIYPGVWCYVTLNFYSYKNKKIGVGFGLQQVMKIADDQKLAGGGGDPKQAFGDIKITAQTNVAAQFDRVATPAAGAAPSIMPQGGHVGAQGNMPVHGLPQQTDLEREMAALE